MEKKKKLVPKLRFKEFVDAGDWEQRKLGEVFEEYSEKNYEELPPLMIVQGGGTQRRDESDRKLMYDRANLSNYKMVKEGDFIVHLRSFEGGLEMATNTGIISPAYHTLHGENTDSRFYYSYFRSKKFIDTDLKPHVYGIRDGRSIDIAGMKTINIPYTNFAEQKAIGDYISAVDNLITLHQRKVDKLQQVKKAHLCEMFPENGKTKPKRRFKGFTDDWEQRKLGEVGTTFTGLSGKTASDFGHGEASFITYMNVFSNPVSDPTMVEHVEIDSKQREIEVGDVFFTTSSETPEEVGMSSVLKEKCGVTYLNSFCFGFRPTVKFDLDYLAYMLRSESVRSQITLLAQGISRFNISKTKMMDTHIQVPSIDEQIAIGKYFSQLDNLITLHQRKVEKLKKLKESYLNDMFV